MAENPTWVPSERQPKPQDLSGDDQGLASQWVGTSEINIGPVLDTTERRNLVKKLLCIWRDCFAKTMRGIYSTDLIHLSIDLNPDAKPMYQPIKRYTPKESAFAAKVFPEMKAAAIIARATSDLGARSQFPPKKNDSDELKVVHNLIPMSKYTMKPQYPMHRIDEVTDTLIKPNFKAFFSTNASDGYWAIPIKEEDKYKTGFVTPHGYNVCLQMRHRFKGTCATYSQFADLTFGPLLKTEAAETMPSIIGDRGKAAFCLFMDNHMGAAKRSKTCSSSCSWSTSLELGLDWYIYPAIRPSCSWTCSRW